MSCVLSWSAPPLRTWTLFGVNHFPEHRATGCAPAIAARLVASRFDHPKLHTQALVVVEISHIFRNRFHVQSVSSSNKTGSFQS